MKFVLGTLTPARFVVGAALLIAGCRELPVETTLVQHDASVVQQLGAGGGTYALDMETGEFTTPTDTVIWLTEEQTAEIGSRFQWFRDADSLANFMSGEPVPPPDTTCTENCNWELRAAPPDAGPGERRYGRIHLRRARPNAGRVLTSPTGAGFRSYPIIAANSVDTCRDYYDAIQSALAASRSSRAAIYAIAAGLGALALPELDANNMLRLRIPSLFWPAILAEMQLADALTITTQLKILVGLYVAAGCTQRETPAPTPPSGGQAMEWYCWTDVWEISYDGGMTWHIYQSVTSCKYRPAEE